MNYTVPTNISYGAVEVNLCLQATAKIWTWASTTFLRGGRQESCSACQEGRRSRVDKKHVLRSRRWSRGWCRKVQNAVINRFHLTFVIRQSTNELNDRQDYIIDVLTLLRRGYISSTERSDSELTLTGLLVKSVVCPLLLLATRCQT